jgi:GTP-binding protein
VAVRKKPVASFEAEAEAPDEGDRTPKKRRSKTLPAGLHASRPMVAVVGRPNVGKSTLFNRLAGERIAIVEDVPGVTRDRHYADCNVHGHDVVLVDTGGFDPESDDPMKEGIARHVVNALAEADVVVAVVDGSIEPTAADKATAALLRKTGKPVVWVANKADTKGKAHEGMAHYALGMKKLFSVSALHGHGMHDLEEEIASHLPKEGETPSATYDESIPRIAIVGRPNAGKSSLVNRLLGEDRQLVDARPGTTVDPIDTLVKLGEEELVVIDTAGIRRKRGVEETVEVLAVMKAIRSIERAHAVVLMIDAKEGPSEQDAKLAGLIVDRGRALVIGLNKADLLDQKERKFAIERTRDTLAFAPWARIVLCSAKTGRAVGKIMDEVQLAIAEHRKRIPTAETNRFFEEVLEHHPPPTARGRAVRLYYVTQAETRPPRFIVVTNEPEGVHFSYQRYVVNAIRERFGFVGSPIRVTYRRKNKKETKGT